MGIESGGEPDNNEVDSLLFLEDLAEDARNGTYYVTGLQIGQELATGEGRESGVAYPDQLIPDPEALERFRAGLAASGVRGDVDTASHELLAGLLGFARGYRMEDKRDEMKGPDFLPGDNPEGEK